MLFADNTGHTRNPCGTGFWINVEEDVTALVTNAHNIDARYKLGSDTKYEFQKIEVELRVINQRGKLLHETEFHEIEFQHIIQHNTADVAILINPSYVSKKENLSPMHIAKEEIATREGLRRIQRIDHRGHDADFFMRGLRFIELEFGIRR